jgi:hypothetical protein
MLDEQMLKEDEIQADFMNTEDILDATALRTKQPIRFAFL